MNINSNEILLMNRKNVRLGNSAPTQTTNPIAEPTTVAPESAMKALDLQGQNNIAFQGVKTQTAKTVSKAMMMALLSLGTASTMTSCEEPEGKDIIIENTVTVTVDLDAFTALLQGMVEQQKITNEQLVKILAMMNEYKDDQAKFNQVVVDYMMNSKEIQQAIYDTLLAQGKTQQEIQQTLNDIYKLMNEGKYGEALNKIMSILQNIDQTLNYILEELKMIRDDINKNHEEYIYNQNKQIEYLNMIYQNGLRKEDIDALCKAWADTNAKLQQLVYNSDKMLNLSAEQFKALMEEIAGLKPTDADYAKFEEMFKLLNMNMQDMFKKYLENEAKAREEYLAQGKDFQANVIGNLTKINEQLYEINNNILDSSQYPGLDKFHAAIEASLAKLTEALEAGRTDVTELLKEVIENQNKLIAEVEAMHKELGNVSSKMSTLIDLEKTNNKATQGKLDEVIAGLKDLKGSSNITNTLLASINEDTAALLLYADKAVNSADQIVAQGVKIEEAIKALADASGKDPSEITYEDLEQLLKDQNEDYFKMFTQYMQDSGLANVSGDLGTVKDLLKAIEKNTAGIKNLDDTLKKVAQIVANIDWTATENLAKLNELIDLLKDLKVYCECNCNGTGSGDNEGTWPGLGDLEDMFG